MQKQTKSSNSYEDIINLPHHVSTTHPPMPTADRAAQFSPFAALTGYDSAIRETARLTGEKVELDEDSKAILDEKLLAVLARIEEHPTVSVTYFVQDQEKDGGEYVTVTDRVKRVDEVERMLILEDGNRIAIGDVVEISEGLTTK